MYSDLNHDGIQQVGEPGIPGWTIHLIGPASAGAVTDSDGHYMFPPVPYGQYTITELVQGNCTPNDPPPIGSETRFVSAGSPVVVVNFPNICGSACSLDWNWRRGPAMTIVSEPNYWPADAQLQRMRPGDVIGLSVLAKDVDFLAHKCIDCNGDSLLRKWGPYEDTIVYDWILGAGDAGTLILPQSTHRNMVMFQIPICGWTGDGVRKTAHVSVDIRNGGEKADDLPITGTRFVLTMTQTCATRDLDGWILVTIQVDQGLTHDDEIIPEGGPGQCDPKAPEWTPATAIAPGTAIAEADAQNLCPEYLTLLSVDPTDADAVSLKCIHADPACTLDRRDLTTWDSVHCSWELVTGKGEFPLGNTGPCVVFQRSRSSTAEVLVTITDSGTEVGDPQRVLQRTITLPRKPKAFVGVGNNASFAGWKLSDMYNAAEVAKQKYEAAGYEVEYVVPATGLTSVTLPLKSLCYQALWLTGHGDGGFIELDGTPPPTFKARVVKNASEQGWGCEQHPFIREVVLLGCLTYSTDWRTAFVCPKVVAFTKELSANNLGVLLGNNPLVWERNEHKPLAPHDLTAP